MGPPHRGAGDPVTLRLPSVMEFLLFAAPAAPLLVALAWPVRPLRSWIPRVAPWAPLPALALALLHARAPDMEIAVAWSGFSTGLHLAVDGVGGVFLLLTALLWTACGLYARSYHATDPGRERFSAFFVLTLAGNLGVVLAGDLLTFYLAFAWMTFAAYGLVVHRGDAGAQRAGRVYIVMALVGEAALLAGLFMLGAAGGGAPGFGAELAGAWTTLSETGGSPAAVPASFVAALVAIGFGVKAGLAPLHVWLPLAHPVAPTAASALLSGAMLKAGLLGWIRVLPGEAVLPGPGLALLVAGTLTVFYGVVVGLTQDDPKTVLAYSSVSQMGYAGMGTGTLLLVPGHAASPALLALMLLAVHHALAKGALFLSVGVAQRIPGEGRRAVWRGAVLAGAILSSLALAGVPATTGAMVKEGLKESLGVLGGASYTVLAPLLVAGAVGTTLLLFRFLVVLSATMREPPSGAESSDPPLRGPTGIVIPWAGLLLAGVSAPLWLPPALALPQGATIPSAWTAPISSLAPVVGGVVLAMVAAAVAGSMGSRWRIRLPPGDLVVVAAAALDLLRRVPGGGGAGVRRWGADFAAGARRAVEDRLDRWNRSDLRWMEGTRLGAVLLGLATLLLLALRG